MATVYTTGKGFFQRVSSKDAEHDYDYDSFVDYDDTGARWDISSFLMRKKNSEKVGSPKFFTWEGEYQARVLQAGAAMTTSATAWTLDSTAGLRVGDIIHVATADEDGQHGRVTAIGSATACTVTRLGTKGTVADNAQVMVLYNSAAENTTTAVGSSYQYPSVVENRVTIVRRSWEWTETEDGTDLYTGPSEPRKAKWARVEFQKDLAHLAWASLSSISTTDATITSKGILPQLAGNAAALRLNAGGDTLSYADVVNLSDGLIQFSDTKEYMVFCGSVALKGLAKLGASSGTYRSKNSDNSYGFSGQAIDVGDMTFLFKFERVFKELGNPYNKYAVALSMSNIKFAHLGKTGKFRFMPRIEANPGGEVHTSQLRACVGVKMNWTKRHGYIFNLN